VPRTGGVNHALEYKKSLSCEVFKIGENINTSEQCGILQEAICDFLAGRLMEDELQHIIEESMEELAEMRGIFRTSVSGQVRQAKDYCHDQITAVEFQFDEYEKALLCLKDALQNGDRDTIESSGSTVTELTKRLNLEFLRFRETVLWVKGPTNHSGMNILLALLGRIIAGADMEESLGRLACETDNELRTAEGIVAVIETSKSFPEITLKSFYVSYRDLLICMREALSSFFHFEQEELRVNESESQVDLDKELTGRDKPGTGNEQKDDSSEPSDEKHAESPSASPGETLTAYREAVPDMREIFRDLADKLEELAAEYDRIDLLSHVRALSDEPTAIPFVNVLFNTARRVLGGATSVEVLNCFIREFEAALEIYALKHSEIMKFETRSASMVELGTHMSELLEEMGRAIAEYRLFAQQPSAELLESCESQIWYAALDLQQTLEALHAYSENESSVTCICCGAQNKVGATACTGCKAVLSTAGIDAPSILDTVALEPGCTRPPDEPKMTRNIQNLFDGAAHYIDGDMTREEFENMLAGIERLFSVSLKTLQDLHAGVHQEDQRDGFMSEAVEKYRSGLEHFGRGLAIFRSFAETRNQNLLDEAKSEIWEGMSLLQSMQKLLEPRIRKREP